MSFPIVIARGSAIEIICPRHVGFTTLLARIPSSCRAYDPARGSWLISEPHVANALIAVRKTFGDYEALIPASPPPHLPPPVGHICPTPVASDHRVPVCLNRVRASFPGHAFFGLLADAPREVKTFVFRRLMQRYHPEGTHPDEVRVREVTQAWEQVKSETPGRRVSTRS